MMVRNPKKWSKARPRVLCTDDRTENRVVLRTEDVVLETEGCDAMNAPAWFKADFMLDNVEEDLGKALLAVFAPSKVDMKKRLANQDPNYDLPARMTVTIPAVPAERDEDGEETLGIASCRVVVLRQDGRVWAAGARVLLWDDLIGGWIEKKKKFTKKRPSWKPHSGGRERLRLLANLTYRLIGGDPSILVTSS